ncbi:hypothetical protein M3Y97_01084700 [Aphelenchoides bicaudatus]|nr:hypothetical protein M3Y97_01084700 [Aphelenchoides bicaudatus]
MSKLIGFAFLVLLVILQLQSTVAGFKCYKCTDSEDCSEGNFTSVDCAAGKTIGCYKKELRGLKTGNKVVNRGCLDTKEALLPAKSEWVDVNYVAELGYELKLENGTDLFVSIFICTGNLCNSSPEMIGNFVVCVFLGLLVFFIGK